MEVKNTFNFKDINAKFPDYFFFWILSKLKDCIFVFFLDRAVHVDLFFNRGVYNKYSPNYRIRLDIYNRRGYNLVLFIKVKERDDSKS